MSYLVDTPAYDEVQLLGSHFRGNDAISGEE